MVRVNFGKMLVACHNAPRGDGADAFVHRLTGDVLFVSPNDEVAGIHFAAIATDLGRLRAAVAHSADWLAVPKHNGRPMDLAGFMLAWCGENGFTAERVIH